MFQNKLNDILAKVLKMRTFTLPCGKYSAQRVLQDTARNIAPVDLMDGDTFSLHRFDPSNKYLKFRPFFVLEGTLFEGESGTDVEYGIFPDWSMLIYAGVLLVTLVFGIAALAMGLDAMLFLGSSIGLNILFYGSLIWQGDECAKHFERSLRNRCRKYAEVIPE